MVMSCGKGRGRHGYVMWKGEGQAERMCKGKGEGLTSLGIISGACHPSLCCHGYQSCRLFQSHSQHSTGGRFKGEIRRYTHDQITLPGAQFDPTSAPDQKSAVSCNQHSEEDKKHVAWTCGTDM